MHKDPLPHCAQSYKVLSTQYISTSIVHGRIIIIIRSEADKCSKGHPLLQIKDATLSCTVYIRGTCFLPLHYTTTLLCTPRNCAELCLSLVAQSTYPYSGLCNPWTAHAAPSLRVGTLYSTLPAFFREAQPPTFRQSPRRPSQTTSHKLLVFLSFFATHCHCPVSLSLTKHWSAVRTPPQPKNKKKKDLDLRLPLSKSELPILYCRDPLSQPLCCQLQRRVPLEKSRWRRLSRQISFQLPFNRLGRMTDEPHIATGFRNKRPSTTPTKAVRHNPNTSPHTRCQQ